MEKQVVQATKRTIRLRRWKIEVQVEELKWDYVVIAAAPMDARIMAFIISGAFPYSRTEMEEGDLALVEEYTKILEVSGG